MTKPFAIPPQPRTLAWAILDKRRPAVVLAVEGGKATVLAGTGTERPHLPSFVVGPESVDGKALQLSKPTYFYAASLRTVDVSRIEVRARCSMRLFLLIKAMLEEQVRQ